ncbi:fimbrial protein [Cupriavidus agavae]|uniref:Major type 1 subunit fimbrin (Pilin) n=1 Tax=Cupriavidus agavae TaxID=1001822 RepID=A0A4Q7S4C2_9BURK|nr:fimbrial protein [Cupriavidus agavae]RZT41255.1 major type 1 subunit fimbrin (pilin) [Cupriavidus agavae]
MKPIRQTLLFGLIAVAAALPLAASASDGTITFTGQISSQTCTIGGNGGGSSTFTVTLPSVSTSALATAGTTAGRTPFSIRLTGCTTDSGNAAVYFEPGATIDAATGRLINVATASPASNVQVGILNADMSPIMLGAGFDSQNSQQVALAAGAATLNYNAEYVATGTPASGNVSTSVVYSIVYP